MSKGIFRGTRNDSGRTPGVQNRVTNQVKESFSLLLENNLETLQSDLDSLKPIDRLKIIIEIAGFLIPKIKAVEVTDNTQREQPKIVIDMSTWL